MAAPRKHSEEVRERIRELAGRGVNLTAISREVDVPRSSIRGILHEARPTPETPVDRMHSWLVWWGMQLPGADDAESIARRVRALPQRPVTGPWSPLDPAQNPKLAKIAKACTAAHVKAVQDEVARRWPPVQKQTDADASQAATVKS